MTTEQKQTLKEDERLEKLLAKTIMVQLFHTTNKQLDQIMRDQDIEEPQDVITRLISGYGHLTDEQKAIIFNQRNTLA